MAKDDKPDETYDFAPPDFDEETFIHREMVSFRTTGILFVWGIIAAAISWALYVAMDGAYGWSLGLLVCAVFGYALKFLFPKLGADISHFKRREWAGTGFLFFFTWLSFFILVLNPPLTDVAAPRIEAAISPPVAQPGDAVTFELLATDNARLASNTVKVTHDRDLIIERDAESRDSLAVGNLTEGVYRLTATASDAKGHTTVSTTDLTVGKKVVEVHLPAGGVMDATTRIVVRPSPAVSALKACTQQIKDAGLACVREVTLQIQDGQKVTLKHEGDGWTATSDHAGWRQGVNKFTVHVGFIDRFLGSHKVAGGELVVGPYSLNVTAAPGTVTYDPLVGQPTVRPVQIPGLGTVGLALGLLAAAAIVARRR